MTIKIITEGSVVQEILSDADSVDIEAVQIDKDYDDCAQLRDYADALRADPALRPVPFSSANFTDGGQ